MKFIPTLLRYNFVHNNGKQKLFIVYHITIAHLMYKNKL